MYLLNELIVLSPTGLISAAVLTLSTLYYFIYLRRPSSFPPGPPSLPIIYGMYARGIDSTMIPWRMTDLSYKYGPIFSLQSMDGSWTILLNDVKSIKEAFVERGKDFSGRPFVYLNPTVHKILNPQFPKQGIVFSDIDEQLKLQKNISMVILRNLGYGKKTIEDTVSIETGYLIEAIMDKKGRPFHAKHLIDNAVANIIISLLFGERPEYNDAEFTELKGYAEDIFELIIKLSPVDVVWFALYIPVMKKWMKRFIDSCAGGNRIIDKKLKELSKDTSSPNFISQYQNELEKDRIKGGKLENRAAQLVKDFYGAGAETTATTLGWSLYFMIKYPEVQEKVRNEINSAVGKGCKTTLKDRERLPYTEATICEILRVACTAPFSLPHSTTDDTHLQGYRIPKNAVVIANIFAVHHDPVTFPEPSVLKPERFLNEKGEFVKHENFIPFSSGRRSCLGEQLARQELFLFFTHLMQSFEFRLPEGDTLPPQKGLWAMTYRPPVFNVTATILH